jgi:hypothetical protein
MPNQMIALQARSPQLPDPTRRTAQFVNMMNMARQQEAAERQTALAQQTMDINKAQEARAAALQGPAITKAQQDNAVQALSMFREAVGDIAEGDIAAAEAVRADLVARVPGYDKFLPPASTWDRNTRNRLMMTAEKEIEKTIATPVASLEVSTAGAPRSVTVGGLNPEQRPVYDAPETPAPRATPTAPAPASQGSTGKFGEARFVPDEAVPLNAYQQEDLRNLQSELGMSDTPASFTRGGMGGAGQMAPEVMARIVDAAFQTGVMAQADFDQLVASQPQQNTRALMDAFRQANITLQADAPSLASSALGQQQPMAANPVQTPQARFADMRGPAPQSQNAGLRGAPPMEQTLAQTRTSTPLQQRNPNVPLAPGSSVVPLSRLGAEKATEAQAAADVNLRMAPEIAKATKLAERAVEKRSEALVAKNETKAAIQSLDKYIEEIDALLRSPDRRFIVGRIEGNLHYLGSLGQNERQAELQAMYDRIKNADTLGSLVEAKQATPTGGSPVGNASNLDVQLIAKSANSLTQTGGVPKFDEDLKKLRREAYRTRQRRIEFYSDRYGDLASEDPKFKLTVRPIADRYISSKDLPKTRTPVQRKASGGFTVVRVED